MAAVAAAPGGAPRWCWWRHRRPPSRRCRLPRTGDSQRRAAAAGSGRAHRCRLPRRGGGSNGWWRRTRPTSTGLPELCRRRPRRRCLRHRRRVGGHLRCRHSHGSRPRGGRRPHPQNRRRRLHRRRRSRHGRILAAVVGHRLSPPRRMPRRLVGLGTWPRRCRATRTGDRGLSSSKSHTRTPHRTRRRRRRRSRCCCRRRRRRRRRRTRSRRHRAGGRRCRQRRRCCPCCRRCGIRRRRQWRSCRCGDGRRRRPDHPDRGYTQRGRRRPCRRAMGDACRTGLP